MSALRGKRIAVTRPLPDAKTLADLLTAHGAEAIITPLIEIQPPTDTTELDAHLRQLHQYDWVVFTSANAVRMVWARFEALGITPRMGKVAAVGVKTGAALQKHGVMPDLIPNEHVAEALFAAMNARENLKNQRIFLPQADQARPVLANLLREAGAQVDAVVAYHTLHIDADLLHQKFDAITFMSASTVSSFVAQVDDIGDALIACIGPVTAVAAREAGLPVHVTADPHSAEGLVSGLLDAFERMLTP